MAFDPEVTVEAAKAAPPVTYVGISLAGVPLDTWVSILTFIYVSSMLAHFLFKRGKGLLEWWKERKR